MYMYTYIDRYIDICICIFTFYMALGNYAQAAKTAINIARQEQVCLYIYICMYICMYVCIYRYVYLYYTWCWETTRRPQRQPSSSHGRSRYIYIHKHIYLYNVYT